MTPAEAHAAAAAEGLALVRAENATGFKHVSRIDGISKPFQASLRHGGRQKSLSEARCIVGTATAAPVALNFAGSAVKCSVRSGRLEAVAPALGTHASLMAAAPGRGSGIDYYR